MHTAKHIDSSIQLLKKMLGDKNVELTSEQQSKLTKGIRDLKRLRKAKKLTYEDVNRAMSGIVEAALDILETSVDE
jgi:hypothetical protein